MLSLNSYAKNPRLNFRLQLFLSHLHLTASEMYWESSIVKKVVYTDPIQSYLLSPLSSALTVAAVTPTGVTWPLAPPPCTEGHLPYSQRCYGDEDDDGLQFHLCGWCLFYDLKCHFVCFHLFISCFSCSGKLPAPCGASQLNLVVPTRSNQVVMDTNCSHTSLKFVHRADVRTFLEILMIFVF